MPASTRNIGAVTRRRSSRRASSDHATMTSATAMTDANTGAIVPRCACRPLAARHAERVAVGIGEHDPLEFAEISPAGFAGAEADESLDLGLRVGGAEVDVNPVRTRCRVASLLEC